MVLGRAYQPPQRRPMDLARHHLETIWQEKTSRETSQAVERRPGQILERHDMAEDSTRQGHLETTCWGLRPTTGHNGCLMMMMMTPLLRALGVQRIPAMRDHQSVNLLKRCLAGSSAASTFYWSLIHNRDIDVTRTLVNKLNLVDNSISRVLFGNTRRLFYDIDNDGLSDSVRFLLHNMNNDNFRILQNILYVDF